MLGLGPVLAGDADTDQTTYEWMMAVRDKLQEMSGGDPKSRIDPVDLTHGRTRRLHELERSYPFSVIDVEPKREELLREALWRPDGQPTDLIMPMRPYPPDVRKVPQTIALAHEVDQLNPVHPRALLVQVRLGTSHARDVPEMLDDNGIPRFKTLVTLKESIGYSLNTTFVDNVYADVLGELGITSLKPPTAGKD